MTPLFGPPKLDGGPECGGVWGIFEGTKPAELFA